MTIFQGTLKILADNFNYYTKRLVITARAVLTGIYVICVNFAIKEEFIIISCIIAHWFARKIISICRY